MLAVDDLHVYYGSAHVLQGVSLRIEAGQIACLVGRNGAGKSTTLKSIMGLLRPTRGTIRLRGERIDGLPAHAVAARGIAWVPEDRRVFGSLTVEENIRVAAQATGRGGPAQIRAALDLFVDLVPRARQLAASLSGGQQQMLAIARALATRPDLLLLDEPTEGLAPALVTAIRQGILASRRSGLSILLVEQNLELALAVGDRFFILSRGRIVHSGTRAELLSRPDLIAEHLGVGRIRELSRWRSGRQSGAIPT